MELFDEFFSLLILIIAIIYTFSSMAKTIARSRRPMPEHGRDEEDYYDEEEDEEESFEDFVQAAKTEVEQEIPLAPPVYKEPVRPRSIARNFEFHANLDDYTQRTNIDDRKLTIHLRPENELVSDAFRLAESEGAVMKRPQRPNIQQLIKSLPEEKLLFLSYEVFHVPVSKRPSPFPWNG